MDNRLADPADAHGYVSSRRPIVHFLYEPGAGGLDRVAILLANGMAERGLDTELWLTRTTGVSSGLISDRVIVRRVPAPRRVGRSAALMAQIPALADMMRRHAPRAVFSAGNQSNLSIALARTLSGRRDIGIIQKITNPVVRPGMAGLSARLRLMRFERTALAGDRTLCLSEADARAYRKAMPLAAARFRSVRNAYVTDTMLDRGRRRTADPACKVRRLLSVGRLVPQKDHATLLNALARVGHVGWSLRIVGDGELRSALEQQASDLGIAARVAFEGFVADPSCHFETSEALVLSSRWEGLPAVPLEAMAMGCRVIATDCSPGLTEILRGCGQAVVPIGDVDSLARAIDHYLSSDQKLARGREKASEYSVASSIDDHLAVLAELEPLPAPLQQEMRTDG